LTICVTILVMFAAATVVAASVIIANKEQKTAQLLLDVGMQRRENETERERREREEGEGEGEEGEGRRIERKKVTENMIQDQWQQTLLFGIPRNKYCIGLIVNCNL
jgi:hypothetical protein